MESWNYAHCLPYFKKMENCLAGGDAFGESRAPSGTRPGYQSAVHGFLPAVQQAGYPLTADVNGYQQEGFAFSIVTSIEVVAGVPHAPTASGQIAKYLTVKTRILTTKLLFSGTRVVGV